jgi:aspartyl-tRNA(Asn)/glutamyl-tRNA(Gln) amidotransferase subunit B
MERGHLRCDANVSIREAGSTVLNTKTEIKNMNSIESVRQAITLEAQRQIAAVEAANMWNLHPWMGCRHRHPAQDALQGN